MILLKLVLPTGDAENCFLLSPLPADHHVLSTIPGLGLNPVSSNRGSVLEEEKEEKAVQRHREGRIETDGITWTWGGVW